ncbi:fumarylacetoacetate hydrolase family protein [Mycolicibacterium stellerae]|uniref:fumarylacetoacetate hydrolase family protein n=1 Tax=Mycolicibacterium stellerae TaxID=2358193 RepID=UPI0013DD8EB7|nr:fumarylacetoacetate hydrolase family protein [Mycolicibacterium stellerae]
MRLALFNGGKPGVVTGDRVVDVSHLVDTAQPARDLLPSLIGSFADHRQALEAAARSDNGVPLASVTLDAPLPRPTKLLCALGNYLEGVGGEIKPVGMFLKASTSVIGHGGVVRLPDVPASVFQHEAELAVVIGRRAHQVLESEAMDYVFGYTALIDVSARGVSQAAGLADKSFDTFGPLGPWIVTADEVGDASDLAIRLWVNDHLRQDYRTSDMENPIARLIWWASSITTLEPGDVISCGTNHQGLGPLQDGDHVRLTIDKIGSLEVTVQDPVGRTWPSEIDTDLAAHMRAQRLSSAHLTPPAPYRPNAGIELHAAAE